MAPHEAPDDPETMHSSVHCAGTIIVHVDRSLTCTDGECRVPPTRAHVVSGHAWFLPCHSLDQTQVCPRCPR